MQKLFKPILMLVLLIALSELKRLKILNLLKTSASNSLGHIIVGIDAKNGMVATDGWDKVSSVSAIDLAQQFEEAGVVAIVYTDISRDGMMTGVNVEATEELAKSINIPVIASGGVTNMDDIIALCNVEASGITGTILGRSIYEGTIDLAKAHEFVDTFSERMA